MAKGLSLIVNLKAIDKLTKPLKKIAQGSGHTADALRENREQLKTLERAQKDMRGFRELKRQSQESGRALQAQQDEIRALSRRMNEAGADTQALGRQRQAAIRQARKLSQRYEDEQRRLRDLRSSMTRVDGVTGSYADRQRELQRRIRSTNEQIERQQAELREVARRQQAATKATERYHRSIGRTNSIRGAGMTGLATGGAGLYAGARMLTPGVEYGEQMSRVQALTRLDKQDPQLAALKQQSRDLGSSTAFSATDVGRGQEFLAMAGFTPDAIQKAIPDMLNLALANKTDLGRTADISSNILSGFGLDPDQMGHVADVLTATTTRANVDLEMLGESMKYVAPQARQMGLSLEQAAAMTALLGNVGIQGSQAGTTLRAMMTRLAAPTGKAAGALKTLGVNAKDAQGDMRDVPEILADVAKATEHMGNADRASYLKRIFGEEPGAGMAELIAQQGAAGIEKFVEMYENAAGESGRVAKTMSDNIGGDLKGLRSAWEEVGISITDTNDGPLRELIQNVTALTRAVGDWIKQNPELAGGIAKAAAGLAALVAVGGAFTIMAASVLGPLVTMKFAMEYLGLRARGADTLLGKFAKGGLKMLGGSLKWLGRIIAVVGRAFLLNPIGLAVTAIAGAAYLIYRNWDSISQFFKDRWRDVKAAFDEGVGGVMRLLLNWNPLGLVYRGITTVLDKMGIEIPENMRTLGGAITTAWDGLSGFFSGLWDTIKSNSSGAWDTVGATIKTAWDGVKNHIATQWEGFTALPAKLAGIGGDIVDGLIDGVKGKFTALKDSITGMASSVKGWFADVLGIHSPSRVFAEFGNWTIEGLINGLGDKIKALKDKVIGIASSVAGWFAGKLKIHSPSREFARLGGYTIDGLNAGLDRQRKEPAQRMAEIARQVTQAGAGIALGAAALPVAAMPEIHASHDVALDTRPPMAAAPRNVTVEGDHITLNVYPSEGMDERALARLVGQMLDERERQKAARMRRNLYDND